MPDLKVLIITYYWPPAGGAGVQRWVKLTKYLGDHGMAPYVLTVDERYASYMQLDESLIEDVSPRVTVYKTKSFEPLKIYARIVGKKKVPVGGFSNVNTGSFRQKIINFIRSHVFIPDPRRGWKRYAYRKALEIIKREQIDLIITSSPPHSCQLTGLKLQKKTGLPWIADMRDPWTDIYYYHLMGHTFFSRFIDKRLERKVLVNADGIIAVSHPLKALLAEKDPRIDTSKIHVIPNGYDHADVEGVERSENSVFTISYTGTIADSYAPSVFFHALKQVADRYPETPIQLQFVGQVSERIIQQIAEIGLNADLIATVTHKNVIQYQKNADLLLLVIPDAENAEGIVTGKLFEYLASENPIICIGPGSGEAAEIISTCKAGKTFERDQQHAIADYIEHILKTQFLQQQKNSPDRKAIAGFSREKQAGMVKAMVDLMMR